MYAWAQPCARSLFIQTFNGKLMKYDYCEFTMSFTNRCDHHVLTPTYNNFKENYILAVEKMLMLMD